MRLLIVWLLSLVASSFAAGDFVFHEENHLVQRQVNASSLNATLLEILTDVEEAKTCNDCEVYSILYKLDEICSSPLEYPDDSQTSCSSGC